MDAGVVGGGGIDWFFFEINFPRKNTDSDSPQIPRSRDGAARMMAVVMNEGPRPPGLNPPPPPLRRGRGRSFH